MSGHPGNWIALRGDGSDRTPPLGTLYTARLRDGQIWRHLSITPFCVKLGADLFRHYGKPRDPVAICVVEDRQS